MASDSYNYLYLTLEKSAQAQMEFDQEASKNI